MASGYWTQLPPSLPRKLLCAAQTKEKLEINLSKSFILDPPRDTLFPTAFLEMK